MQDNINNSDDITADVGGNYVLCPAGNWIANCYAMIVIGTVMESYQGSTPKPTKKVMIGFEITSQTHVFDEKKGPEPFIIWVEHLLSLNTKANLRKMIHSWAGQSFTDEDMKEFKINELVGTPCLAMIIADKNSKGEDRSKIATITAVPAGMMVPDMINQQLVFTYKNPFDQKTFDRIPAWIQKKMKTSTEYNQALGAGITQTQPMSGNATVEQPKKTGGFPFGKKPV